MSAPATAAGYSGRLTIDVSAIARNWRALEKVTQTALTGAVVKANAYGCGIPEVAPALAGAGAQFFFVATLDEGLTLRRVVPKAHIFVLNGLYAGAAELYAASELMPVLSSVAMLEEWLQLCIAQNTAIPAAFHFDTGMNRLGMRLNEASLVNQLTSQVGYQPQMVMSHLACADQPQHEKNRTQLALFQSLLAQFPNTPASLANSAGLMTGRDYHFQMVRPGIALYGGRAVSGRKNPMQAAVTLEVPILQVKEARTGETVGYGATQTLARDSRLAIIAHGYADGYFRSLSGTYARNGGKVSIKGKLCPVLGRVSMDLVTIDATDLPDMPAPGELVEIFGPNVGVDDVADAAGTIGYEVLTSMKGRYERVHVGTEAVAETPTA